MITGSDNNKTGQPEVLAARAKPASTSQGRIASSPAMAEGASLSSIGLDTVEDDVDDALKVRVLRASLLHEPLKHVGIFAGQ